jgi:hypothetical protein
MDDIRKGLCPLCRHNEIVETSPKAAALPIVVASIPRVVRPELIGLVRMYVCRSYGNSQFFTTDPASIPITDEHDTRLITGPAPEGPYR